MVRRSIVHYAINWLIFLGIVLYIAFLSIPFVSDIGYKDLANTAVKASSDLSKIASALDCFYLDNHSFPYVPASRFIRDTSLAHNDCYIYLTSPVAYLPAYPADPFIGDGYTRPYRYYSDTRNWYLLASDGPDGDTDIADNEIFNLPAAPSLETMKRWIYHPSNGNLSDGDVIRIGP